ncbi:thioredoxin domain-containing protein [Clostridium sp. AM58-1XD]|uniref:thioredoxin domain-containing protein n=1 Tax=Clostridium sp. AM58-1XD TaxID=2292307 RepID=UPI000E51C883|nr:thioredoxin domain-containing protein [Clostridium sp. AM58-1XD]RGZ00935.1 thioredoxin domain-containing protein [Clostridium sp. AM58-1XD]
MANHLINEKSPYLLQHAKNPVDWYPWSDEAFEKAAAEDKPVFLSIGYSTCHWCHVMAHESFEDHEIAHLLNTRFVPVKVDREERPEVDLVYMSVCQAMTGQGGWPLTIIMTPSKKPFFAGTYLPARSRYHMTGLQELLVRTAELWSSNRKQLLQFSEDLLSSLKQKRPVSSQAEVSWDMAERGYEELNSIFDRNYCGFGRAPKFPVPHNLLFLLMFYERRGNHQALAMAEKTLVSMARGGIHDQIGGGFSRYSTDDQWLVPHFEKMLYDNALLVLAYLEGYRLTNRSYYKETVQKILSYIARELTGEEGGFYCGQDADSEGVEGKYYVFTKKEISRVLDHDDDSSMFCRRFSITKQGNFEGKNIPNLIHTPEYEQSDRRMDRLCSIVYEYRLKRTPLHTDDKILTSWNSMMIMAFAKSGFLLDCTFYEDMAKHAQEFTERRLTDKHGRLLVRYRGGESAFLGNLDDYAYNCLALLTLYEVTLSVNYLEMAVRRAEQMVDLFWDHEQSGFFFYGNDAQELIERPKEIYDGAVPSGNSAAAHVLLSLAGLTAQESWRQLSERQLDFLASGAVNAPSAHCFSLMAFMRAMDENRELICVSSSNEVPVELSAYLKKQAAHSVFVLFKCPANEINLSRIAPFTRDYAIPESGVRYYLCKNHACGIPFSSLAEKMEFL